jgi:hypothetical protein
VATVPETAALRAKLSNLTYQLSQDPTSPGLAAEVKRAQSEAAPAFLVTFRNAPEIDLVRSFLDAESGVERPYASRAGTVPITITSSGADSRGITVDSSKRAAAEADCAAQVGQDASCFSDPACVGTLSPADQKTLMDCLVTAALMSLDVYVASRAPPSLLVGRTTPDSNLLPAFYDTVPLTLGPSRVSVGKVRVVEDFIGGPAKREPRVFLSCFDSRRIYIYNQQRRELEMEVITGRGPYAMAIDEVHDLLYVGHFTDSFIGVVSLDSRFPRTYGKVIATIGQPTPPRASK